MFRKKPGWQMELVKIEGDGGLLSGRRRSRPTSFQGDCWRDP